MRKVILIVLDGYGIAPPGPGNAVYLANPPNLNSYLYAYPNTVLKASGESVGLPASEPGNTEVGHINLGAGRIVYQDLPRINMSIADGSFYKNPVFQECVNHLINHNSKLHLIGLVGEGTVHASLEHLYALLYLAKERNIKKVYLHLITDGRDSPPKAGLEVVRRLLESLKELGIGEVASVSGRYYALDRDRRWERTEKAYVCLTEGKGKVASSPIEAIEESYKAGVTDEFIEPTIIIKNSHPVGLIEDSDSVVFFNYRIDRPRQLTKALVLDDFEQIANKTTSYDPYEVKYYKTHLIDDKILSPPFKRQKKIKNLCFVTMTEYEKNLPVKVAFPPIIIKTPLGRVLSENSLFQLRVSESEKERFVTFYFNGQREMPFPYEERLIIPSPKVPTYDLKPEMSAFEMTDILIKKIQEQKYSFILVNFANPDMVGHTGNIEASIKAVKSVDSCVQKIVNIATNLNYSLLITADHGNVEQKINPQTGEISTEHTSNPVPFIFIDKEFQGHATRIQAGILADVAPTVLRLLDINKPVEMTGRDLLEEIF
ncbi:MAG: 2,3-bisphosphoglycerate-independent phosphoglycerate mutase [Microgenomates group bacterium]|nr:2,3-bisphosphoglycerate-independent phosphoglycerate mutase [Microgenomates group bacterium]